MGHPNIPNEDEEKNRSSRDTLSPAVGETIISYSKNMRIIVFGDSISEGCFDYEFGGWANRLKADYMKEYLYDRMVMNYGISGYTSDNLVDHFESLFNAVSRREPGKEKESIVIFAIGINDSAEIMQIGEKIVDIEKFEENIRTLIEKCQVEKNIKNVIFLGNINVDEAVINNTIGGIYRFYNDEIQKYNNVIKRLARDTTCSYLELFGLMESEDLQDGLHPSSQGHEKIYKRVQEYLA